MKHLLTFAETREVLAAYVRHRDGVDSSMFPRYQMFSVGPVAAVAREQLESLKNDDVTAEFEFYSGQIGQS